MAVLPLFFMRSILLISTAFFLLSSHLAAQSPAPPPAQSPQSQAQSAAQSPALPGAVPPGSTLSGAPSRDRTLLPNGWYLTPAGQSVPLSSDLPLNMALAPDGIHLPSPIMAMVARRSTWSICKNSSWSTPLQSVKPGSALLSPINIIICMPLAATTISSSVIV